MPKFATAQIREVIGWLGFILILGAYLAITLNMLVASSPWYHGLNLFGAVCMALTAKWKQAKPLFWLNVIWALIALGGLAVWLSKGWR